MMNFMKKQKRYTSHTRNNEAWLPYLYQKPLLTSLLLMSGWPPSDWSIKITNYHAIGPAVSQIEVSLPYLHTNAGLPRCDAKLDESKDKEGQASVNTAFCFSNQIYFWFCFPHE